MCTIILFILICSQFEKRMTTSSATIDIPHVEHAAKKRKITNQVCMVTDFMMSSVKFGDLISTKGKCDIIPITTGSGSGTVLVQLSGGGMIPKTFGVEEMDDDPSKVSINLQVSSENEYNQMVRIRSELIDSMSENWSKWHNGSKNPSKEVIDNFCNHVVQPKKLKKNSTDQYWDGLVKSKLGTKCRIIDMETNEPVQLTDLPGRKWHKAVFEFKQVYILGTKSFGITKVLKYLLTSGTNSDDDFEPL